VYTLWKTQELARIVGVVWLAAGAVIYWLRRRVAPG